VGGSCYAIDANGANKTLAYRDREAGYLWEAKVSGSGRYLAAVAEIAGQAEMPLRVVDLHTGHLLHSATVSDIDVAMEGFAAEGCFDWHLATDALAYIPWPPGQRGTGLRTFSPATGRVSTLAPGLKVRRLVWRQDDRTLLALYAGTVVRIDPGNSRTQTVWVPRLPAKGEAFDFLNRFLCLRYGQVLYCREWDQSQPDGFFSRTGERLDPQWPGAPAADSREQQFADRDLLWAAGDQVLLSEVSGFYGETAEASPCRLRLLKGAIGDRLSDLKVVSVFEEWRSGDAVLVSPDGDSLAMGVGLRSD
jgi:hypothetical protein